MKRIFLLRHGEISATHCYIGATDVELSVEGVEKLKALRPLLSAHLFDHIFCSPLKRCTQSSFHLGLQQEIRLDNRLREVDFGNWEGKSFAAIAQDYPDEVDKWCRDGESFVFPGGEAVEVFRRRVVDFCKELAILPGKKILIITHGGVIRHMICQLLGFSLAQYLIFQVDYGRLTTIELFSQGGVLSSLNQGVSPWQL